jgi:hypothetical protein
MKQWFEGNRHWVEWSLCEGDGQVVRNRWSIVSFCPTDCLRMASKCWSPVSVFRVAPGAPQSHSFQRLSDSSSQRTGLWSTELAANPPKHWFRLIWFVFEMVSRKVTHRCHSRNTCESCRKTRIHSIRWQNSTSCGSRCKRKHNSCDNWTLGSTLLGSMILSISLSVY